MHSEAEREKQKKIELRETISSQKLHIIQLEKQVNAANQLHDAAQKKYLASEQKISDLNANAAAMVERER